MVQQFKLLILARNLVLAQMVQWFLKKHWKESCIHFLRELRIIVTLQHQQDYHSCYTTANMQLVSYIILWRNIEVLISFSKPQHWLLKKFEVHHSCILLCYTMLWSTTLFDATLHHDICYVLHYFMLRASINQLPCKNVLF